MSYENNKYNYDVKLTSKLQRYLKQFFYSTIL